MSHCTPKTKKTKRESWKKWDPKNSHLLNHLKIHIYLIIWGSSYARPYHLLENKIILMLIVTPLKFSGSLSNFIHELRTCTDIHIPIFRAALFTIAKRWKEPRCPSTNEWINKMFYTHTMGYYIQPKKEMKYQYMLQHGSWKHAKWKKSDTEVMYCMIPFLWRI